MIDVKEIGQLHERTVVEWHKQEISNPYSGLLGLVCDQHSFNYRLWHQEDKARCPNATDETIADVKRKIDKLNQQRNDWIEKVDDFLTGMLEERSVNTNETAPINTETPGSVMDRLSIMELRIYHMAEQQQRTDSNESQWNAIEQKLALCKLQRADLSAALQDLLNGIATGKVRHRTYRQMKMYNDPALNPYLNGQEQSTLVTRRAA